MSDFLADCAERIIVLGIVHRRIINRFRKFILWLGIPLHRVQDTKPNEFCRIVSEFALEYRTTRERVIQQLEKKANHRERNKTRGKMITEVSRFRVSYFLIFPSRTFIANSTVCVRCFRIIIFIHTFSFLYIYIYISRYSEFDLLVAFLVVLIGISFIGFTI